MLTATTPAFSANLEDKLDKALLAIEKLSEENQALRKRLSKVEAKQQPESLVDEETTTHSEIHHRISSLEEVSSSTSSSFLDKITINGYTSFEFERQLESDGFGDTNGSFDADLFDIVLNVQVNDSLRVAADITWEHGSATEEDFGNVALEYAFAEYAFSNLFKLRAGKMFTPFGFFNEIHTAKPAYLSVKEAGSTNKPKNIIAGAPRFYPRWGVGLALQGNTMIDGHAVDYNLMISNGDQDDTNPFEEDNNTGKAAAFRTRVSATDDLQLGYSLYYDDGLSTNTMSHGLQFEYLYDDFRLLGEGVWGEIDSEYQQRFNHYGWFLQTSYHLDNGLTPYFRFEHYDPDTDISNDHGFDAVLGINFNYNNLIFKLENNYYFGASESTLGTLPGNGYNEIKGAIVVGF